jgi:hypothetical protein
VGALLGNIKASALCIKAKVPGAGARSAKSRATAATVPQWRKT